MIEYHYELDFELSSEKSHSIWLERVVASEGGEIGQVNYIFCNDQYLLELNRKYLNHNTLTDILTFDSSEGKEIVGDIFISIERVRENASDLEIRFEEELLRVMSHGVLHILGYKDKTESDRSEMRIKEDEKIKMFHVEQ